MEFGKLWQLTEKFAALDQNLNVFLNVCRLCFSHTPVVKSNTFLPAVAEHFPNSTPSHSASHGYLVGGQSALISLPKNEWYAPLPKYPTFDFWQLLNIKGNQSFRIMRDDNCWRDASRRGLTQAANNLTHKQRIWSAIAHLCFCGQPSLNVITAKGR